MSKETKKDRPTSPEPGAQSKGVRPQWVADQMVTECQMCKVNFTTFTRRHHCRKCGGLFCWSCSNYFMQLPPEYEYNSPQRVCRKCHGELSEIARAKEKPQEEDALVAQYYLRANPLDYENSLLDLGSRKSGKRYFQVRNQGASQVLIMYSTTSSPVSLNTTDAKRSTFINLLRAIKHPYIFPLDHVGFYKEKQKLFVTRPLVKGSLRDIIYKANPFKKPYEFRYEIVDKHGAKRTGTPIPLAQLQKYGNQILQALAFLKSLKVPYPHLHTENVLVTKDGNCSLSEIENTLLGFAPYYQPYLRPQEKEEPAIHNIEVVCFGHVLFEMALGYPKHNTELKDAKAQCPPKVYEILEAIFPEASATTLTVEDLLKKDLFASGTMEPVQVTLDGKMAAQLKTLREHTPNRVNPSIPAPEQKEEKSNVATPVKEPAKPEAKKPALKSSGNVSNTVGSPPPPPAPAPPPPKNVDLPPMSSGRSDLLSSIRNADNIKKLKKVNQAKK